jgi:hypothetical protein
VGCLNAYGMSKDRSSQFTTSADFCELFMDDSRGLYLLSILLTADHQKAKRCFIASRDECIGRNSLFRGWAHSWTRRTIARNAVRMLTPNPGPCDFELTATFAAASLREPFLARVLALGDFERLVYVLSVLEEYADQNCADLLRVSPQRIRETRNCALKHIGHLDS